MPTLRFIAMPTRLAAALRDGAPDANGRPPERRRSDGSGLPCRHCLADIAAGAEALLAAWRPFVTLQPYAETGPVFLHRDDCRRHRNEDGLPAILRARPAVLLRAYDADERIIDGSGRLQPVAGLDATCEALLADPRVASVHLRSATNGCYLCRVERHGDG